MTRSGFTVDSETSCDILARARVCVCVCVCVLRKRQRTSKIFAVDSENISHKCHNDTCARNP